jgi:hypothetical protein
MTTRSDLARQRTSRRSPIAALALMALAVAALAAGCVLNHDPRDDGSRLDAQPRDTTAISTHIRTV